MVILFHRLLIILHIILDIPVEKNLTKRVYFHFYNTRICLKITIQFLTSHVALQIKHEQTRNTNCETKLYLS